MKDPKVFKVEFTIREPYTNSIVKKKKFTISSSSINFVKRTISKSFQGFCDNSGLLKSLGPLDRWGGINFSGTRNTVYRLTKRDSSQGQDFQGSIYIEWNAFEMILNSTSTKLQWKFYVATRYESLNENYNSGTILFRSRSIDHAKRQCSNYARDYFNDKLPRLKINWRHWNFISTKLIRDDIRIPFTLLRIGSLEHDRLAYIYLEHIPLQGEPPKLHLQKFSKVYDSLPRYQYENKEVCNA